MNSLVIVAYVAVYISMLLGGIPGFRVDRTGAALLGAILMLVLGGITEAQALQSVDVPTLALLFGMMVVSAQFQLGGLYGYAAKHAVMLNVSPAQLLAVVIFLSGAFSAVLTNDVVCLAIAPLLVRLCLGKGLNPVPFLLALACAANLGSAATLIGNPQNILIGETLDLSFNDYLRTALPPCTLGLAVVWVAIYVGYRGDWLHPAEPEDDVESSPFDVRQTCKGAVVLCALLGSFLFAPWPRELVALAAAGVLMLNRTFHSRRILGLVDWPLLVLFISLFVVNKAFQLTGGMDWLVAKASQSDIALSEAGPLFLVTAVLSNLVSNVPAVMLLLPIAKEGMGPLLALSSSLAGNLIIVGSIANIIVVEAARQQGVVVDFRTHAKIGVPVTVASLLIVWLWLQHLA